MTSSENVIGPAAGVRVEPRFPAWVMVERCLAGEESAWDDLIRTFTPLVWTVAQSFRLRHTECEDVCQQTWLRVYENIDTVTRPDRIAAWIVTIARRESLRLLARGRRYLPVEDMTGLLPHDDATRTPEEEAVSRAEQHSVLRAFRDLPARHQALLGLLLMQDPPPTYDEISVLLAIPRGSIGPTRRRLLGELREAMRRANSERSVREALICRGAGHGTRPALAQT